jgi:RNA polymerase sigma-70 factor (ECF subfamily)
MRPELIEAVRLLRSNDRESVSEAISLLQNTVYAFSMKVCGHPEDAEDTMQDVLVRSLPHLAKISDPRALAVWLYTVTRNRCWRIRRKSVHAPKQTLSLEELMPDEMELSLLLQDVAANPESRVLLDEQNQLLHKVILSVSPEYRLVLVLHDIEDLDTEQIAEILDLLPGTVRVRLHRARLYVRRAMSQIVEKAPLGQLGPRREPKREHKKPATHRPQQCREIFANLSEYLDGRMEARSCQEMRQHIEACPACIAFIRDLRLAIDRCRELNINCDPEIAPRLRTLLTTEYLRMLSLPVQQKSSAIP